MYMTLTMQTKIGRHQAMKLNNFMRTDTTDGLETKRKTTDNRVDGPTEYLDRLRHSDQRKCGTHIRRFSAWGGTGYDVKEEPIKSCSG